MATLQSDLVLADVMPDSNVPAGMVLSAIGTYIVPTGGLSADDVIEMVPIPEGAQILDIVLHADNGTASLVIDVGDGDDVDRYLDGVDGSAAVIASLSADGDVAASPVGHTYSADDTIDITLLAAGATATHVYTMTVTYVMG